MSTANRSNRYAGVRKRKELERTDETLISMPQRFFRRTLERESMLEIVEYNHEVTYDDPTEGPTPLWFDAEVLVKLPRSKRRLAYVDRTPTGGAGSFYTDKRQKRKHEYCREREIPYLIVSDYNLDARLRTWVMEVKYDRA